MRGLIFSLLFLSYGAFAVDTNKSTLVGDKSNSDDRIDSHGALVGLRSDEPQKSIHLEFPVERVNLPNGMVFLLHSQRSIPIVSYHTWFRVGAKDELPGESGLAHMFEHMMFKGTKKYPNKDFDRILQANGIVNNAFTTQDYTGYYEILPSSKLDLIMDMESDRMQSLVLSGEEFQKEREVVKEERRMRYDNSPGGMGWEKLNELVFQDSKYALPVIGTMKEINDFSVEKLQKFYSKWYIPSNAVVVIVGDFDIDETKKLINKFYGSIQSPPRPTHLAQSMQSKPMKKETSLAFPVQSPEIFWAGRTVKGGTDEAYALDLLSSILGQGKSSRLFQELVYKKQTALAAGSGHYTLQDGGMIYIQATAKPGVKAQELKAQVESTVQEFLHHSIREDELTKAKNMVLSDYIESLKTTDGKAKILAMNEILLGDYKEFFRDIERYQKVTMDDINNVRSYLLENRLMSVIVDKKEGAKQ